MTVYPGNKVPLGHEKETDFVTEVQDAATEPYDVEVQFRRPDATVIETDTLLAGTVYRPTGSTADNDPGHFAAKALISTSEAIAVGYTVYGRWKELSSSEWTAWALIESFDVVEALQTIEAGAPYLASETDVRDFLADLAGVGVPTGMTSTRIQRLIEAAHNLVLATFEVDRTAALTAQQQVVGRGAVVKIVAGNLLLALNVASDETRRAARSLREDALADVQIARKRSSKTRGKRFGMRGIR